ncbi:hypothetical protein LCGC14_1948830 [marine sediment metagenome]|uniref:Uncharacterized protein n=1 Tax=marine sediment metagenome TaxID=412755 RepID=A0A0F9HWE6_9ZZZZ
MTDDSKLPHLKIIDAARLRKQEEDLRDNDYKRRAQKQKNFYAQARVNAEIVKVLKEALSRSVILNEDGTVLFKWSEELIESITADIEDPGTVQEQRKRRSK